MLNTLQIIFLDLFNFDKKGSLSPLKKWELIQSEFRTPHSAIRTQHSALRIPQSAFLI
jgi:hypothetical protein